MGRPAGRKVAVLSVILTAVIAAPAVLSIPSHAQSAPPASPTTQPLAKADTPPATTGNVAALETRAAAALGKGDFANALPLLRRMADFYKNDARKLAAVEEQIKLCEKNMAAGITGIAPTFENRKPHAAPVAGQTLVFEKIQDLGNFEYDAEKGGGIPADVKALSGSTVKMRGYMIPMDQAENITTFALVPSLFACCFGQPPQIQHTIIVQTPKGKSVSYYPDEITVEGTLKVEEKKEEGFIVSVFEMAATSVRPAAK